MDRGKVDVQVTFQVNEGFTHKTPVWNPYIGNDYIAKVQKSFPDRIIGLAIVNPWLQSPKQYHYPPSKRGTKFDLVKEDPALDEVERCIMELGLWGLKLHPFLHGYHVNSSVVHSVMDKLVECQRKSGRKLFVVCHTGGDSLFNSPDALGDLAERYHKILFIAAHSGFIWGGYTVSTALARLDNVKLDLTTCCQRSIGQEAYDKYGAEKFTVGSDMPYSTYGMAHSIVEDMFKKHEERELVLGGNLARYLGISWRKSS